MNSKNGLDIKKIVGGIVVLIALALGIIHPTDLLSDNSTTQSTQSAQVEATTAEATTEEAVTAEDITAEATTTKISEQTTESTDVKETEPSVTFRNQKLLDQHYKKHGEEMGFASAAEYEAAAAAVVANPNALHKIEAEDGDDVYYIESTNEFVIVSKDGYLRTYFNPSSGIRYYNRQ